jgi:hypothetical protein
MRRTLARTFILAIVATVAHAFNENGEANGKPSTIETLPPDPQGGGDETGRNDEKTLDFRKKPPLGPRPIGGLGVQIPAFAPH